MEGWISLHRKITEHPDYLSEPFTHMGAWIDLLLLANYKESFLRIRGIRVRIGRGQVVWAQEKLAARWQWSRGKVKRYLDELEADGQIAQQKNNLTNCLTIVHYDRYQTAGTTDRPTNEATDDTPDNAADRLADVPQTNTSNNYNTVKKENKTHTQEDVSLVDTKNRAREILVWVSAEHPAVAAMREPLTEQQAYWLARKYDDTTLRRILAQIDNKGATANKNTYATFVSFAGRDYLICERREAGKVRHYTYEEMCDQVAAGKWRDGEFERVVIGDTAYWMRRVDVLNG